MPDLKDIAIAANQARTVLNGLREGIAWFRDRGMKRDELLALLDEVGEGGDLADIQYAEIAGGAQDAIDRLMGAVDDAEAGVPEPVPAAAADQVTPDPVPAAEDTAGGARLDAND